MEPLNTGHYGANDFVTQDVVAISEVTRCISMCKQGGEVERQRQSKQVKYNQDNSQKSAAPNLKPLCYSIAILTRKGKFLCRDAYNIPCDVSVKH